MKKKRMFKQFLAVVLCLGMLAGNLPYTLVPALAAELTTGQTSQQNEPDQAGEPTGETILITALGYPPPTNSKTGHCPG